MQSICFINMAVLETYWFRSQKGRFADALFGIVLCHS